MYHISKILCKFALKILNYQKNYLIFYKNVSYIKNIM